MMRWSKGQRQIGHRPNHNGVLLYHGPLLYSAYAYNGTLRLVYYRSGQQRPGNTVVRYCESAVLHVIRMKLPRTCPCKQFMQFARGLS